MHVSGSRNSHKQDKLKQMLKSSLNVGRRILICILFVAVSLAAATETDWTFICDTDNCDTYLKQYETSWVMVISCADGDYGEYYGYGIYEGTISCSG